LFNVQPASSACAPPDYLSNERVLGPDCFDVDLAICPEQILTDYIVKLIEFPEALQVLEFAHASELGRSACIPKAVPWSVIP